MTDSAGGTPSGATVRDGLALTEDLIRRKAEHNEGMLSTLEEVALHQLDIDRIETLNHCRQLKIVYLQSNLISRIEGLHRLKRLEYLNLALNNISCIEGLDRCESLQKLDLTVNFIDLDSLHTVGSLKNNSDLRELFLTGNPCEQHWENGCRHYVVATLPQLESFDGKAISKSERLLALQRLPALEHELSQLAPKAVARKAEQRRRRAAKQAERAARGEEESAGDDVDEYCPEVRVADAREAREQREAQEAAKEGTRRGGPGDAPLFGDQMGGERRFFKADGTTPVQMNTAKWPFSIEDDGASVVLDIALPRFLDSAQIDADVQPTYVLAGASTAERSATTGHLKLTCPKLLPIIASPAPRRQKLPPKKRAAGAAPTALLPPPPPEERLTGAVSLRIVPRDGEGAARAELAMEEPPLGDEWEDEDEVPALL